MLHYHVACFCLVLGCFNVNTARSSSAGGYSDYVTCSCSAGESLNINTISSFSTGICSDRDAILFLFYSRCSHDSTLSCSVGGCFHNKVFFFCRRMFAWQYVFVLQADDLMTTYVLVL